MTSADTSLTVVEPTSCPASSNLVSNPLACGTTGIAHDQGTATLTFAG